MVDANSPETSTSALNCLESPKTHVTFPASKPCFEENRSKERIFFFSSSHLCSRRGKVDTSSQIKTHH